MARAAGGRAMRRAGVVLALALAGCGPTPAEGEKPRAAGTKPELRAADAERTAESDRIARLAADRGWHIRVTDGKAEDKGAALFAAGVAAGDPETIEKSLTPASAADALAPPAAQGLSMSKSPAAESVLVRLAVRDSRPPEAVEALFSYYRMRGGDMTPPATLPDAKLLEFADHATPRGRAALGHLARVIKDPALLPALERLAKDGEFEVRRGVALGLGNGPDKTPRSAADAARCVAALKGLVKDADAHVVAAACRALASYDDPVVAEALVFAATHEDFNVRVAALEGMGRRKIKD